MNKQDYVNYITPRVTRAIYFRPQHCYRMNEEIVYDGHTRKIIGVMPDRGQICVIGADKWLVPLEEMTYNEIGKLYKTLKLHFAANQNTQK